MLAKISKMMNAIVILLLIIIQLVVGVQNVSESKDELIFAHIVSVFFFFFSQTAQNQFRPINIICI